ncbi:GDCCVxC domain-containing (seleno)protein [Psychroserpens luteus]|uniref:GDCCVxC domain-containing (Seleno)protein n=2 Tax=Psychroserpens luteus TaxID=1434066 RepID=A0ABW5ZTD0_9FLAO
MIKINKEAIMSCPICGSKYKKIMPQIGKHINSECVFCHTVFGINNMSDCCVYCVYSDVSCPKSQKKQLITPSTI